VQRRKSDVETLHEGEETHNRRNTLIAVKLSDSGSVRWE